MTGKTHQIIGISAGLAVLLLQPHPAYQAATVGWALVLSSVGSLLPDIDQPGSRIWRALPFGGVAGELVNPFLEHRNFTHSFLGFGTVWLIVWRFLSLLPAYWHVNPHVVLASFLGAYGSHLLADMLTVQGIPLFFPNGSMMGIPPRPFEGIRIETGKWFENYVVFPAVNALLVAMAISQWPMIHRLLFL